MKKAIVTAAALLLTAALAWFFPNLRRLPDPSPRGFSVIRIWSGETDGAVNAWLKKRAAAWERQDGSRVYLRAASAKETEAALDAALDAPPDLLLLSNRGEAVARRGYALILRDDQASVITPAPTSALFFRPSPTPGPSPSPAPAPSWDQISPVVAPVEMARILPGAMAHADPAGALSAGTARAALLTAEQAAALTIGYRALPLNGASSPFIGCSALTAEGEAFLSFLLSEDSQRALADHGLYSPYFRLYGSQDSLRALIESGMTFP